MPEINLNDVPIRFPFEPYEVQKNYMQKVIECLQNGQNGVLESPTGTGKTLSLLCASLAWLEIKKAQHRAKALSSSQGSDSGILASLSSQLQAAVGGLWKQGFGCPKIIYSSRTHSQLSQAVNELKKTTYTHMKVSVLGSRDQMCIHPEVSKETNNNNKVHMCQLRVKGRTCYYYNQVESKKLEPEIRGTILDLEDLVKLGKKRTFCPYYMAREICQEADIIFLPYNYLLDPKSRRAHGIELQGNIVIFDEAHNVEKICEESASLQLRSTDIALCIDEVTHVMEKLQQLADSCISEGDNGLLPEDFSAEDLYILKTVFLELEKLIDEITIPSDGSGVTYPGSFMVDLLQKADITPNKKGVILDVLEKLVQYLTMNSTSPFQRKGTGLQKFSELIKIVFSKENFSLAHLEFVKQCYKVHVNVEEKWKSSKKDGWGTTKLSTINGKPGKVLSYWCFNPGFGMKDLAEHGIHSIILTSGTLSPLDAFTAELQVPFPILLENPHIIQPCQVWVGTLCKGPDGNVLNSSYQNRSKPEYMTSLGLTILNLSRVIPGGLLVFFPSYPVMKMCQEHWQNTGLWNGLNNSKPVFAEPQSKDGFLSAMNDFYDKVRDPNLKGACFMAVCRGKVSEGLDFANRNGRAVIITGLPYPPFKDPRVVLKQKYLEEARVRNKKGLTGTSWYKLEASRAVNQAIGRVIRHKDDFGAIILCDKRFGDFSFKQELSSWVRPHLKGHESFGLALKEIIQFFRVTKSMFPEPALEDHRKKGSNISLSSYSNVDSTTSSMVSVTANAFEMSTARAVAAYYKDPTTQGHKDVASVKDETDLNSLYTKSSVKKALSKSDNDVNSLFSALDQASSVLDFTSIAAAGQASDQPVSRATVSHAPKRKKIKVVNRTEKDLKGFFKDRTNGGGDSSACKSATLTSQNTSESLNSSPSGEVPFNSTMSSDRQITIKDDSSQLKVAKIAKYLKEVKSSLSSEQYKNFSVAIKTYKQSSDVDCLIATLLPLFANDPSRHPLLQKFSLFLRPNHRKQLASVHEDLVNL